MQNDLSQPTNPVSVGIAIPPPPEPTVTNGHVPAFIEALPKWRDGVLVFGGLVYLIGYLSWTYHAWSYQLGFLSLTQAQCFAAGLAPTIVIMLGSLLALWLRWLSRWRKKAISEKSKKIASLLQGLGVLAVLTGIPLALLKKGELVASCGFFLMLVSSFFSREKKDAGFQSLLLGATWLYLVVAIIFSVLLCFRLVLPSLPQGLGGGKVETVVLDVDIAKVSTNTLDLLFNPADVAKIRNGSNRVGVLRSIKVGMLGDAGEYMLLQMPETKIVKADSKPFKPEAKNNLTNQNSSSLAVSNRVFKLRRDAVEGILAAEGADTPSKK